MTAKLYFRLRDSANLHVRPFAVKNAKDIALLAGVATRYEWIRTPAFNTCSRPRQLPLHFRCILIGIQANDQMQSLIVQPHHAGHARRL